MSSPDGAYTTAEEYLRWLGVERDGDEGRRNKEDAYEFILDAEEAAENFCGCSFDVDNAAQKIFDGSGTRMQRIPPLRTVTEVKVGQVSPVVLVITGDIPDVFFKPQHEVRHNGARRWMEWSDPSSIWIAGNKNVHVTGNWGYADDSVDIAVTVVPRQLKRAVWRLAQLEMARRDHPMLLQSEGIAGGSVQYRDDAEEIPKVIKQMMRPYRMVDLVV